MKSNYKAPKAVVICLLSLALNAQSVYADPIWHCSRSDVQIADASDNFTLAALSTLEREVIRVSLHNLHTIYQGGPVRMSGGLPLSACIVSNDPSLTNSALQSLGAKPEAARTLLRQNSPTKSNIHFVAHESEMLSCINKNHPAIGYLSSTTHTEAVGPCF